MAAITIDDVSIFSRDELRVVHVLGSRDRTAVIAVPRVVGTEGIITVLRFLIVVRDLRNYTKQVLKLIEKIPCGVVGSSVGDGIPGVGPPFLNGVDGTPATRRVHREDRCTGKCGGATMEDEDRCEHRAPLMATWNTYCRRRAVEFLQERFVGWGDVEGLATPRIAAGLLHVERV